MSPSQIPERLMAWLSGLSPFKKSLLGLAVTVFLVELAFRRLAPKSRAYAAWTKGIEGVGSVWTAVLLSLVYLLSVGPVGLVMKMLGKDPLDRALRPTSTAWHLHEASPMGLEEAARHPF